MIDANVEAEVETGDEGYKEVRHEEVGLSFAERDGVRVFWTDSSEEQKELAAEALPIIEETHATVAEYLGLKMEDINRCSLVFCDSPSDPYITECEWFSYVDGIQCWPVIGESSLHFKEELNSYLLFSLLPHELSDTTLRAKDVDPVYGGWIIEGISDYIALKFAAEHGKIDSFVLEGDFAKELEALEGQRDRVVDLSNRSSFEGFGAPGSEDMVVFYTGSLVAVKKLVDEFGIEIVPRFVKTGARTKDEIYAALLDITGRDVKDELRVTAGEIHDGYLSILLEYGADVAQ